MIGIIQSVFLNNHSVTLSKSLQQFTVLWVRGVGVSIKWQTSPPLRHFSDKAQPHEAVSDSSTPRVSSDDAHDDEGSKVYTFSNNTQLSCRLSLISQMLQLLQAISKSDLHCFAEVFTV